MSSSVPAAVVNLYDAIVAEIDSATIAHFGPPMRDREALEHVCVAHSPGGGPVIDPSSEWAALGAQRQEERYEIACALVVWSGESTEAAIEAAFLRAYAIFAQVCSAVAQDYTLADAVREARVASHSTSVDQTDNGDAIEITFRVACAARVTY